MNDPKTVHCTFAAARKRALDANLSVVEVRKNALVRTYPNGKVEFMRKIPSRVQILNKIISLS